MSLPKFGILAIIGFALAITPSNAALEVIGSGFGRTGTDTLRESLNTLGYKTYHMREIIDGGLLSDVRIWHDQAENNCADVDALKSLFDEGGWTAAVDFPTALCWETLMKVYPNAKVIHTQRKSAEQWWDSASNSIMIVGSLFPMVLIYRVVPFFAAHHSMVNAMWSRVINKKVASEDSDFPLAHKEDFLAAYEANTARVKKVVPRNRLLIQDHSKGWTKLCEFLGKAIPETSYPHSNKRADFHSFANQIAMTVIGAIIVAIATFAFVLKKMIGAFVCIRKVKKA